MMRSNQKRPRQRGATIIEFALVASVFFLILLAIFEFARAFYVRNSTQHLTRCIAREAVVHKPSQHDVAKQNCLAAAGGAFFWPFYQLDASDMRGLFKVDYCTDITCETVVTEPGSNHDDQLGNCLSNAGLCFTHVRVRADADTRFFGLLRGWLGDYDTGVKEPETWTTMPAESMGHLR